MNRELPKTPPMPTPEKGKCSSCEYFNRYIRSVTDSCRTSGCVPTPLIHYRCRRNAPTQDGWPEVDQDDSCGEYKHLLK